MARTVAEPENEILRTDFSGTIWFGATLIATSITLAGLLASGWRPHDLSSDAAIAWWLGGALVVVGMAALAYAGCPVQGSSVQTDDRVKTIAIRVGLVVYALGSLTALAAVLLG